jgi:uncharacterized membrane protein YjgN (DUF898 family)
MAEPCPRCGTTVPGERCPQCGLVIALYHASLEKMRRGPSAAVGIVAPVSRAPEPPPPSGPAGFRPPASAGATPIPAMIRRLQFHGSPGSLFGIQAINVLLTLLTLGVYYFWGKARIRSYLLGQSELERDRFAYHGTGRELFVGFLKGLVVFGVPFLVLSVLPAVYGAPDPVTKSLSRLLWLLGLLLVPVAMVGSRRYRLSRTSWRGIRFSFRGSMREFVGLFVVGSVLTSLTLGIYYPVFVTKQQAFMISHSYFGSRKFDFDGRGRSLIGAFLGMIVLFLPTVGLSWFWFSARRHRFFTEHTRFDTTRFRSTVGGARLAWLQISNIVAIVLTLGLAWPWTVVRSQHFYFRYVTLEGPLDVSDVQQDARPASATGEGLAGLLDADFGVS